jgi:hypothetical protein
MSEKKEPATFLSQVRVEFPEDSMPIITVKIPAEFKKSDGLGFAKIVVAFVETTEWGKCL